MWGAIRPRRANQILAPKQQTCALWTTNDLAAAIRDQIVRNDPNFIEGQILTASIMAAQGKPDAEVIAEVEKAIAMDPKRIDSYISLERLYMTREKPASAETAIKRGIDANPNSAPGYTEYGRFLMYAKRNDESEVQFKKAISIDNGSIEAREAMADLYSSTQQYPKAEQVYVELVQLQDNSPESRLELAGFYKKAARRDDATECARCARRTRSPRRRAASSRIRSCR